MTIASGIRSQTTYAVESTFGTAPVSGYKTLPYTTWGVNTARDEYENATITGDRMARTSKSGNHHVTGDLDVEFSAVDYDPFFENLLNSTWSTGVISSGTTRKSMTIEQGSLDIGQFTLYRGVLVNKFDLTIPVAGMVTAKWNLMAQTQDALTSTSIDTTPDVPLASAPYFHESAAGFFKEGGSPIAYFSALNFSIDNGLAANFALGATAVRNFTYGLEKITGSATAYFEDAVIYNKFINNTMTSIDVKLDDGTHTYQFYFPRVKYTTGARTITGNAPITIQMNWQASFDATAGTNVVITKT